MTNFERIASALESIAKSLERIANPLMAAKCGDAIADDRPFPGSVTWIDPSNPFPRWAKP